MRQIRPEIIESLRKQFPAGTEVELIEMDDPQAPPAGTRGKVAFVDDIGTIHVSWSTGSGLGIVYGLDACRKVK